MHNHGLSMQNFVEKQSFIPLRLEKEESEVVNLSAVTLYGKSTAIVVAVPSSQSCGLMLQGLLS